jgi:hypothetical protein
MNLFCIFLLIQVPGDCEEALNKENSIVEDVAIVNDYLVQLYILAIRSPTTATDKLSWSK